jgi:hypothetical protein
LFAWRVNGDKMYPSMARTDKEWAVGTKKKRRRRRRRGIGKERRGLARPHPVGRKKRKTSAPSELSSKRRYERVGRTTTRIRWLHPSARARLHNAQGTSRETLCTTTKNGWHNFEVGALGPITISNTRQGTGCRGACLSAKNKPWTRASIDP